MPEKKLTVKGVGKTQLKPDQIEVKITIESQSKDYNSVTKEQAEKTEEVKNAIGELGFSKSKIKTSDLIVETAYENVQDEKGRWIREFSGFRCVHNLSLQFGFDSEKLHWIISAVSSCKKASPAFSISFNVKNTDSARDKLLEMAVQDAVSKAAVISSAANINLGEIINISYGDEEPEFNSPSYMRSAKTLVGECDAASTGISVTPQYISSSLSVVITWEILN